MKFLAVFVISVFLPVSAFAAVTTSEEKDDFDGSIQYNVTSSGFDESGEDVALYYFCKTTGTPRSAYVVIGTAWLGRKSYFKANIDGKLIDELIGSTKSQKHGMLIESTSAYAAKVSSMLPNAKKAIFRMYDYRMSFAGDYTFDIDGFYAAAQQAAKSGGCSLEG